MVYFKESKKAAIIFSVLCSAPIYVLQDRIPFYIFTGYVVAVPKQKCEKYNMNNIFCWYCSFDCIHYAQKYNKQQLIEYHQALS